MEDPERDRIPTGWLSKFLSVFFQLLYHQFAWIYDLVSWIVSWGQWRTWIMTPLPKLGDGNILELGFGPGHFQLSAVEAGKRIFGIDLSPQMVAIARNRLFRSGLQPKLALGNGKRLPFGSQSFDQIVATFPTEYIFSPDTLIEINRVLSADGELILLPMAWITGKGWGHRFLSWLFQVTGQNISKDNKKLQKFEHYFQTAGFSVEWEIIAFKHSEILLVLARKQTKTQS